MSARYKIAVTLEFDGDLIAREAALDLVEETLNAGIIQDDLNGAARDADDDLEGDDDVVKSALASLPPDEPTGRISTCRHCGQVIAEVKDGSSGVLDWYSDGGDYGCGPSPETRRGSPDGDDGVGGHAPREASS